MKKTLYDYCMENKKKNLLQQWDYVANDEMTPMTISYGSGKKAWWICAKGHKWQAVINSRTSGSGCPVCSGKTVLVGNNDLTTVFPDLAAQWHPTKNLPLIPSQVTQGSHRRVWWRCEKGHEWKAAVKTRSEGCGCPVCAGRKLQTGENDLKTVCPNLANEWHPEKNGSLTPDIVLATTSRRVWWRCKKGHEWQAQVKKRKEGNGCPVCSGQQVYEGVNDLKSCYPLLAMEWHPEKNGRLMPQQVTAFNNKRVWWKCKLGHEWQASIYSRTNNKTSCPYCTNRKVLAGFNDLATVEPQIATQWHPTLNEFFTAKQVTAGSKKKAWWICPQGHVWKAAIYSRTGPNKSGCPVCAGNISKKQQNRYTMLERGLF